MGWIPSSRESLVVVTILNAGEPLTIKQIVEAIHPATWKHVSYMERALPTLRLIGREEVNPNGEDMDYARAKEWVRKAVGPYEKYDPPLLGYQGIYMLTNALEGDKIIYRAGRGEKSHAQRFAVYTAEERKALIATERRKWADALHPTDDEKAAALEHEKATGVKVRFEVEARWPNATRRLHLEPPGRARHTFLLCRSDAWQDALEELGIVDDEVMP